MTHDDDGAPRCVRPPYAEHTGAKRKSTTQIDIVGRRFDIWCDDDQIMADGKYLI